MALLTKERKENNSGKKKSIVTHTKKNRWGEQIIYGLLFFCGMVSILTTVGIVVSLFTETLSFFQDVSLRDFLTDTKWTPLFKPQHFGILPLLSGTLLIAVGASIVALPIGLGSAIYLSEYAPEGVRRVVKPVLEILAGIPTIVYGYFALTFVTPVLRILLPQTNVFNAASASIVVGIMIIPMVSSLSEDAMLAVPRALREGAYALGATKYEVATGVVVPAALSGIIASFVLAISRAIGETMIVTIAAGSTPKLTLNPLESVQTMTAYIVQVSLGDTPFGTIEYKSLFAVGMVLFFFTLGMNVLSQYITRKYRRVY
ncbi:MAG: phosphate transport system permease protein [Clostridia bacterium]|nr:phosphate transporter rane protein 1, PhoT family [Clostridiales bacterium]MDK2986701.1 phosphate transport system permease protein [Clostridia bacterium]